MLLSRRLVVFPLILLLVLTACSVNPVTGEKQLLFMSAQDDLQIGQTQYKPAQQSQGGIYYLDPKLNAYVKRVGQKLAAVSDQPQLPYEFVILNNSVPNAWALPSGKIAINRGLLIHLENEAQLAAVLSHEIVHAAARHGAQRMRDNMLMQAGLAGLGLTLADNDYRQLIIGGATLGATLTVAKYGRDHELESDRYGMEYMARAGYDLQGAVELQKLFVSFSKGQQSGWIDGLFASHPPSQERVDKNIATAQALNPPNGLLGREAYQDAIAYLKSKQPAYELADKAAQSLQKGALTQAMTQVNEAIEIEPREALFHSLKGSIYEKQGKSELALKEHNQATSLHPEQFSYFLRRAETQESLGNLTAAKQDYERSLKLLPTSVAALELGNLYQQSGNTQRARTLYSEASTSSGTFGTQAKVQLAKLEINEQPEKYLKVSHVQDPKGPLLVQIQNRSPLGIRSLTLVSRSLDAAGNEMSRETWRLNESLEPGSSSRYTPLESVYHLPEGHRIQTRITNVSLTP